MSIVEFLLAVLSSGIFWCVYFSISIIVTLVIVRKIDEDMHRWITGKEMYTNFDGEDKFFTSLAVFVLMCFWPLVIMVMLIWQLLKLVSFIFGKGIVFIFSSVDKVVPEFDIKIKKK